MDEICHDANCQFQHVWIMSLIKSFVSAWLERKMVKIVCFSMTGMCHGQNRQSQHVWNVSWFKWSVPAWLECVMVKIVSFRMARMSHNKKPKK
jgi:hypothetical protein